MIVFISFHLDNIRNLKYAFRSVFHSFLAKRYAVILLVMAGMLSAHVSDFKNASAIILNLFCVLVYLSCPKFKGYLFGLGRPGNSLYICVYHEKFLQKTKIGAKLNPALV